MIEQAQRWIAPYWNAEHLRRTLDWLLELDPGAGLALQLAALTHDMERHFPGGPVEDLSRPPEANMDYRHAHSDRSAFFVSEWLTSVDAPSELADEVIRLIRLHEFGGDAAADVLQAADSISFLEINTDLPDRWLAEGRCDLARGLDQHRWMFERIQVERARELALPFYRRTLSRAT